jgi:uncharacterized protein YndB with AHSA1/START domain
LEEIYHCFWVHAPLAGVYSALTDKEGLSGWWTKEVTSEETEAPGGELTFRFKSGAFNKMKMKLLEPNKVEWECLDGHEEWIRTFIRFELRQEGELTKVCFSHYGWRALTEYVGECSFHWAYYFISLQKYCETGQGTPNEGTRLFVMRSSLVKKRQ